MVILGGLEVVAAGYLIHKHQKNKQEKQRIRDEQLALEEQQYRLFPPKDSGRHSHSSHSEHRRRRSHSRHSDGRRHSTDGKSRRESPRPPMPAQTMATRPPTYSNIPIVVELPPPQQPQGHPQDMKYGWTDDQELQRPQDPSYPPTGWPAHWAQTQTPATNSNLSAYQQPEQRRSEQSRGRPGQRASDSNPRVHFASSVQSSSQSPPPSYRS